MSSSSSVNHFKEEVLFFRDETFYSFVKENCGDIVLEIMQAQDISSVECLLDVGNIFTFLELDSDELIPLKKKSGIILNDGSFVVKKGILHKVEIFTRTLRDLNQQHSISSLSRLNNSSDLIIPEDIIQKFPFLVTLITYSNFIITSKIDFTFFNLMMTNIINNSIKEDTGYRYDSIVRQFASALYILGGRTAYEFVRINVPAFLPSIQSIQSSIASSENYLTEGHFDFNRVGDYFNSKKSTLAFGAEDCTATVSKVVYDTQTNTFIGFSLPLDQNGLPIVKSYSTDSFTCLENWYLNEPMAKSLVAHLIQPLSSSLENISPYLLSAYGTNNKFKSSDVIVRWGYIYRECKAKGVRVIGYSSDCDSRYLNAMKRSLGFFGDFAYNNHPDNYEISIPNKWNWFLMQSKQLFICMQDPMHICTKLRNRLLSKTATLVFGDQLINIQPLYYIIDNFCKLDHGLVQSDVNPKDRQNYGSCEKITDDKVLKLLENIPNSLGISIYLQVIKCIRLAYIEKSTTIMDRIFYAWVTVFIFRIWSMWMNAMNRESLDLFVARFSNCNVKAKKRKSKTKRDFFITYQSHFSIEINAHSLVYLAVLFSEGQVPPEALNIWLQNSQTCESIFRSARSISSTCSAGVNFTVSQFLARIKKLSMLQHIKNNVSQNHLRFPQHHKLSTASQNASSNVNTALLSKNNIEIRVLDAYQYVINLLSSLKLNQCLRNQQQISIEELSRIIAQHLGQSWTREIDENINEDSDVESDNETGNNMINDLASNYDSEEDFEFDGGFDCINNVTTSANRGVRLVDNVKEKFAQTYFRVTISKQIKFLHKQTACWLLEKDKSALPADRLSRVQEQ